jgi:putative transposase
MASRSPIAPNEWYHCFNRGVDKRAVFLDETDRERLLILLYLCNDADANISLAHFKLKHVTFDTALEYRNKRGSPLVHVGAYAFMPNHVHIVLQSITDSGLSLFMQKLFTAYTMYFNKKYERTGPLFSGRYKSKHLYSDEYFKHALQYVLFNPIELAEPEWKSGKGDLREIEKYLLNYRYASALDFFGIPRAENIIVQDIVPIYFDRRPHIDTMLKDAQLYYQENSGFLDV